MKLLPFLSLFSFLILVSACHKDKNDRLTLGVDSTLAFDQTVYFEQGDFDITFDKVLEDSRCPTGAECIWEGRAIINLLITENKDKTNIELVTFNSIDQDSKLSVEYGNYRIELKAVNPYPDNLTTNGVDYSVVIRLTNL